MFVQSIILLSNTFGLDYYLATLQSTNMIDPSPMNPPHLTLEISLDKVKIQKSNLVKAANEAHSTQALHALLLCTDKYMPCIVHIHTGVSEWTEANSNLFLKRSKEVLQQLLLLELGGIRKIQLDIVAIPPLAIKLKGYHIVHTLVLAQ